MSQSLSGVLRPRSLPGFHTCFRHVQGNGAEGLERCSGSLLFRASSNHVRLTSQFRVCPPQVCHLIILPSMVQLGPWGLQAAQGSLPSTDPPFSPLVPPLSPILLTPEKADTPAQPPPTFWEPGPPLPPSKLKSPFLCSPSPSSRRSSSCWLWPQGLCISESSGHFHPCLLEYSPQGTFAPADHWSVPSSSGLCSPW